MNPKLKSVFSNAFRFLRLGRRPKPLDSPAKPLELPARWRHYEDERGIHVEACDENGVTKAVLRIREVGINRQQLIINAEHLKKSGYSEKAANLLRLAARRLAAETSRPNAVVTIGKESWLEGKKENETRLNAEQEASMEDLVYGLNWLKPPARRPPSNRMVEDEPPYKWVVTFKKPPLKIKEN